jgi:hypothetical protein
VDEKRVEAFLSLYKQQMEHFHQTQGIEWKGNFGIWTLLAGAVYFAGQRSIGIPHLFAVIALTLLILIHGCWLFKVHSSETEDKKFWARYRGEALQLIRGNQSLKEDEEEKKTKRSYSTEFIWLFLEVGVTILLCALLYATLFAASQASGHMTSRAFPH